MDKKTHVGWQNLKDGAGAQATSGSWRPVYHERTTDPKQRTSYEWYKGQFLWCHIDLDPDTGRILNISAYKDTGVILHPSRPFDTQRVRAAPLSWWAQRHIRLQLLPILRAASDEPRSKQWNVIEAKMEVSSVRSSYAIGPWRQSAKIVNGFRPTAFLRQNFPLKETRRRAWSNDLQTRTRTFFSDGKHVIYRPDWNQPSKREVGSELERTRKTSTELIILGSWTPTLPNAMS